MVVAIVERRDGILLIDTGYGSVTARDPNAFPGELSAKLLGLQMLRGEDARSQIQALGLDPDAVRDIVPTHLHHDHAGGLSDFPNATVHVTHEECGAAWGRPGLVQQLLRYYHPGAWRHRPNWKVHTLSPTGVLGFPRSLDLFGDGEILLLDTSGHTPGHVAVAVRLSKGYLIHVGDAAFAATQWTTGQSLALIQIATAWSYTRADEARKRIGDLARGPHDAVILCSHDPILYAGLRQAPQAYE